MERIIIDAVKKIEFIHEKMTEEYTYKNIYNQDIGIYDYSNKRVSKNRVEKDRDEILTIIDEVYDYCRCYDKMNEFSILYAIYCNIYIKWGFHARLYKKGDDDNFSLEKYIHNNNNAVYFKSILCGIRDQDYRNFENIIKENPECPVSNLYLVVKYGADFCCDLTQNKENINLYENKMWSCYERLNSDLRCYVTGEGEYHQNVTNLAMDENYLPYIDFKSIKEYLTDYIVDFYNIIKSNLGIDEVKSTDIFNEILEKFKVNEYAPEIDKTLKMLKNAKDKEERSKYVSNLFETIMSKIIESKKILENNAWNFTFLFEKLDDLSCFYKSGEDYIKDAKFVTGCLRDSDSCFADRNEYLHIPQNVFSISRKHFLDKYKIYSTNREFNKIESKFKNLINDLNKYADGNNNEISLNDSTDRIHEFLNEISSNKLKTNIYYDEYENELNKLIVNYREKLDEKTISDIEASRDLSRVAPEKMDLILMPVFRSIEQEIKKRIFDEFFDKFQGLKCDKIKATLLNDKDKSKIWLTSEQNLKKQNSTLGSIVFYDKEFLWNADRIYEKTQQKSLAFYFKKFINNVDCAENYYEMIQLLKDYRYNELTFAQIRNAVAHRNENDINKFDEDILNEIMNILIRTPDGIISNMLKIDEAINSFFENEQVVPKEGLKVEVHNENGKGSFELNGFTYKCNSCEIERNAIIDRYDDDKKYWIVK